MRDSVEFAQKLVRLIASPLPTPSGVVPRWSLSQPLSDAVSVQRGAGEYDAEYIFPNHTSPEGYIHMALGHVSANPSSRRRSVLLEQLYVYPDAGHVIDPHDVNRNNASAQHFIAALKSESHEESIVYGTERSRRKTAYVISGPRGVGKTCFMNHLITRYNKELSAAGFVWIRLHLPDEFGGDQPDLAHWLRSKAALVLLRYYSQHLAMRGFAQRVRKRILDRGPVEQVQPYLQNLDLIQELFGRSAGEALSATTVNPLVAKLLVDEAHASDLKFIFVIDGFDKVDITVRYEARFRHIVSELRRLFSRDTKLNGSFVVMCRERTLSYFTGAKPWGTEDQVSTVIKGVTYVPYDEIMNRRMEILKKVVPMLSAEEGWPEADWTGFLEEFQAAWSEMVGPAASNSIGKDVEEFYGRNNRAKSQLVQLAFYNFMVERAERRRYLLVEAMTKGGQKYPPRIYRYCNDEHGHLVPETVTKLFDNVFMPTLFSFPYAQDHDYQVMPDAKTYLLAPLRAIQVIGAYSRMCTRKGLAERVPLQFVCQLLGAAFSYDEKIVYLICQELCEFGLMALEGSGVLFPTRIGEVTIRPLPKLAGVLGGHGQALGKSMLGEIAYLNLCAMRCLLPRDMLDTGARIPFIRAMALRDCSVAEWTRSKVINAVTMLRLLKQLDAAEFEAIKKRGGVDALPREQREILSEGMSLGAVARICDGATDQLIYVFKGMKDEEQSDLTRALVAYEREWCRS